MSKLFLKLRRLPCLFGLHRWVYLREARVRAPGRICPRCWRVEELRRGAGSDQWFRVKVPGRAHAKRQ